MGNGKIRTRFLSVLSDKQRLKLTMESPQRSLTKGEFLYLSGDEAEMVYILVSGRIKITRIQENGRENPLEILEAGELLGLEWIEGNELRVDYAQAMEACRVIAVSPERLQALLADRPELHLTLLRIMGEKLRDSQNAIERLMLRDVKARLASLLLDLAQKCGIEGESGVRLATRITHQEMANLIGSTRETTTAMLGQLRRSNLIRVQRREITIAAWDGLERLAS